MQKPRNERDKIVAAVYRAQGIINMLYDMASSKIGFACGDAIDDTIDGLEEIIDLWDGEFNEAD